MQLTNPESLGANSASGLCASACTPAPPNPGMVMPFHRQTLPNVLINKR